MRSPKPAWILAIALFVAILLSLMAVADIPIDGLRTLQDKTLSFAEDGLSSESSTAKGAGETDASGYSFVNSTAPDGPNFGFMDIGDPFFGDEIPTPCAGHAGVCSIVRPQMKQAMNRVQNSVANETDEYPLRILYDDNDQVSWPVELKFDFEFYGVPYSKALISTNGFLTFADDRAQGPLASGLWGGEEIPGEGVPDNLVAGFWSKLDPTQRGLVLARTIGEPGDRVFVAEFRHVGQDWPDYPEADFQIHLYEKDDSIEVHYRNIEPAVDPDSALGIPRTAGIENADGIIGLEYVHNQVFAPERLAVRYFLRE